MEAVHLWVPIDVAVWVLGGWYLVVVSEGVFRKGTLRDNGSCVGRVFFEISCGDRTALQLFVSSATEEVKKYSVRYVLHPQRPNGLPRVGSRKISEGGGRGVVQVLGQTNEA